MSNSNKNGYLLLSSSDEWYNDLSLEELQKVVQQNKVWVDSLVAKGKVKGGVALGREGAIVSGNNKRSVSDGPFAESKEVIGGYMMLDVATLDEALAIAKSYPCLQYDISIEVRPLLAECPSFKRARERLGLAAAIA